MSTVSADLKLVDITSFYSSTCGGIRTYYREKARWLPQHGVECHFVVPGPRSGHQRFANGVLHTLPGPALPGAPEYHAFGQWAKLARLLCRLRPDIVEIGSHYVLPLIVRLAIRKARKRPALVGFYHADFPATYVEPAFARTPRLQRLATGAAWRLVQAQHRCYQRTLVASRHIANRLAARGVRGVRRVGLGVDIETFAPATERRDDRPRVRLAYAGRLAPEKQIDILVRGVRTAERTTELDLRIAGDGPLRPEIERLAAAHRHVRYVGCLSDPRTVRDFLVDADAVIAPGEHESFSLLAAEAMATGTPVIGAHRGGNGELVRESGGGLTFRSGCPDALAGAIRSFCAQTTEARAQLGDRGRDHIARELTWSSVMTRVRSAYDEARRCSS